MTVQALQKVTHSEEVKSRIAAVAKQATDADRAAISSVVDKAKEGKRSSLIFTFTPPMSAIVFLERNPHNRDWSPLWSEELARRQTAGQWCWNNATLGFYNDGALADGQNRMAASALADFKLESGVILGLDRSAISTIDGGKLRHAADAAKLAGISNAKRKETLVRMVAQYLVQAGDRSAVLRSETEFMREIEANNVTLEDAIEIGTSSSSNIQTPQLGSAQAQAVAYLMLRGNWPVIRIREKLAMFQTGVSQEGESAPFFVAQNVLSKAREARVRKDKLSPVRELGVVMYAMQATEKGISAVQKQKVKDAVRKELPNPTYPGETAMAA